LFNCRFHFLSFPLRCVSSRPRIQK
jgi:hypothetical protein